MLNNASDTLVKHINKEILSLNSYIQYIENVKLFLSILTLYFISILGMLNKCTRASTIIKHDSCVKNLFCP
jgi:hypothetical protein